MGAGRGRQWQRDLLQVFAIQVTVAAGPDKVSDFQVALLGYQVSQQGITVDIKGHTQENIGAALVQLAGQSAIGHIELEECMAGRQGHIGYFGYVPGRYDQSARIGVFAYLIEHRSEEHTSELQSLMRISYAVFCLKKKKNKKFNNQQKHQTLN